MQHVINALAFLTFCGMMKVCFQHLATLAVPASLQGRTFLLLAMLSSVGGIAGNLLGSRLLEHESGFTGKGATPFLLASSLFLIAGCTVAGFLSVPAQRVAVPAVSKDEEERPALGTVSAPDGHVVG